MPRFNSFDWKNRPCAKIISKFTKFMLIRQIYTSLIFRGRILRLIHWNWPKIMISSQSFPYFPPNSLCLSVIHIRNPQILSNKMSRKLLFANQILSSDILAFLFVRLKASIYLLFHELIIVKMNFYYFLVEGCERIVDLSCKILDKSLWLIELESFWFGYVRYFCYVFK